MPPAKWLAIGAIIVLTVAVLVPVVVTRIESYQARENEQRLHHAQATRNRASNTVVVVFSRSGNTAVLARHLATQMRADFYRLEASNYALGLMGWAGAMFLASRTIARLVGGYCGARLGGLPHREAFWYGPALLPQAGVAVGMALVAGEQFPNWAASIMAFTLASTVVFEVLGPPLTLMSIRRAAER